MKFIESAIKYRPKRSPIFWGLIALVLVFITPLMLTMLGATFHLYLSFVEALIKGDPSLSDEKVFWEFMLPMVIVGMVAMVCSVIVFSAMLCLIFRKYHAASKLLVAGPMCFFVIIILVTQVSSLKEGLPPEGLITPTVVMHTTQRLLIFVVLFLYAKKYLIMENTPTAS